MQEDPTWKKLENENGFPFYFNEATNEKQWDHPLFQDVKHALDECNYVKYSKYRLALKFRVLQRSLFTESILLNTIITIFDKHRFGITENTLCLESYDLEAILSDIYFAVNKQHGLNIDVDNAVELMQNFIYNIYDKDRQGNKLQVSAIKLVLALLSNSSDSSSLFLFIFTLCADHNNCTTRLKLRSLLLKLVEVFNFLHEDTCFGHHLINSTIDNCFKNSPGLVGINESYFIAWLEEGPQLLCWVPIVQRLKISETVIHPSKCSTCKCHPLAGLKYHCVKCSKYVQCQQCFFSGKTSHNHKLSHSMKEYSNTNNSRLTENFIKKLYNLIFCSLSYNGNNQPNLTDAKTSFDGEFLYKSGREEVHLNPPEVLPPHAELQLIIKHMEVQNRELQRILLLGKYNENEIKKYLQEHNAQISAQIHKLKLLKNHILETLISNTEGVAKNHYENIQSTPMVPKIQSRKMTSLAMLSPIFQESPSPDSQQHEEMATNRTHFTNNNFSSSQSQQMYSLGDISCWTKDRPMAGTNSNGSVLNNKQEGATPVLPIREESAPVRVLHNDLDDALAKLQQILANNFTLDESLGHVDNNHLKHAVSEVEDMLTSFIDTVEGSRSNSVQLFKRNETDGF